MGWTGGRHVPPTFVPFFKHFVKINAPVAEWSVLQTGQRGDPSSIPTKAETFFVGIKILEQFIACLLN